MRIILTILLVIGISMGICAQQFKKCATQTIIDNNNAMYSGYQDALDAMLSNAVTQSRNQVETGVNKGVSGTKVFRIPVVVHIVYTNASENLDDSLVYNQIEVLNTAFRRNNADTATIRSEFRNVAADVGIEFYLANTDPNGQPTSGITRTLGTEPVFLGFSLNDEVKATSKGGIDPWPTNRYLNIWVCDIANGLLGILGYAYPPPVVLPSWPAGSVPADTNVQGVVIDYKVFGRNNPLAVNDPLLSTASGGKSCVHEVGHFLGMRHIWGDGGNGFGGGTCAEDDYIFDTPETKDASQQTCDWNSNNCPAACNGGPDYPDMIENYMDYSEDNCLFMFTWEQARTMRYILENFRPQLANVSFGQIKAPLKPLGIPTESIVTSTDSYTYYIGNPYFNFNNWNSVLIPGDTIYTSTGTEIVLVLCDSITITPNTYYTSSDGSFIGIELGDTAYTYSDGSVVFKGDKIIIIDSIKTNLKIFPNPNNGSFFIQASDSYDFENIKIVNLLGEIVYHRKQHALAGETIELDVTFAPGVYILTGTMDNKKVTYKLMVH